MTMMLHVVFFGDTARRTLFLGNYLLCEILAFAVVAQTLMEVCLSTYVGG
jgi:hypothetical protein